MLLPEPPKFSVPFVWITSAKITLERKRKICRYFVNGTIQSNSCFDAKKLPVPFDGKFSPKFPYKWQALEITRANMAGVGQLWTCNDQQITLEIFLNKPTKPRQNWHFFLTCFVPALFYRCLHPGLTSDLTSFSLLTNFTSSGTFVLRKYLSLVFLKKKSDVWRTSAPFFDRSSHIDNFKEARTFLYARWFVFEWRFSAGMI